MNLIIPFDLSSTLLFLSLSLTLTLFDMKYLKTLL
jgi:hypothetical protein